MFSKSRDTGFLSIDEWLQQEICCFTVRIKDEDEVLPMNRHELIKTARDKDGGAHFDQDLECKKEYVVLKHGVEVDLISYKVTTESLHLTLLRQLGYEVLNSDLKKFLNDLCI